MPPPQQHTCILQGSVQGSASCSATIGDSARMQPSNTIYQASRSQQVTQVEATEILRRKSSDFEWGMQTGHKLSTQLLSEDICCWRLLHLLFDIA